MERVDFGGLVEPEEKSIGTGGTCENVLQRNQSWKKKFGWKAVGRSAQKKKEKVLKKCCSPISLSGGGRRAGAKDENLTGNFLKT